MTTNYFIISEYEVERMEAIHIEELNKAQEHIEELEEQLTALQLAATDAIALLKTAMRNYADQRRKVKVQYDLLVVVLVLLFSFVYLQLCFQLLLKDQLIFASRYPLLTTYFFSCNGRSCSEQPR
jgi:hypothetical protein